MADLHDTVERKFVESFDVGDYEILTDTGWCDIARINKTVPYEVWELKTENHSLKCADTHIVFDYGLNEVFVKDLKPGDAVATDSGDEKVVSVENLDFTDNMYDIELSNGTNHRYYMDGILSHNSTSYNIFVLWYCMFHSAKAVMMCAQREATAVELLSRIRLAYEYIPEWIKPSVVEYNKKSIEFGNMSSIKVFATKGGGARGNTANCLTGDAMVTVVDDFGGIYHTRIDKVEDINANSMLNCKYKHEEFAFIDMTERKRYFYVYKITNIKNGMEYIGFHATYDLDDGYMGSGIALRKAIEQDGIENFKKEIIEFFDTPEEGFKKEAELVNEEYVNRLDTYNIALGGFYYCMPGWNVTPDDDIMVNGTRYNSLSHLKQALNINGCDQIAKLILAPGNGFVDPIRQEIFKKDYEIHKIEVQEHIAARAREQGKNLKRNKKISLANAGRPRPINQIINRNPEKIRKTAEKHRGMKRSDIARTRMSDARKKYLSMHEPNNKGMIWIHNESTGERKYVERNTQLEDGWALGIGSTHKRKLCWYYDPNTMKVKGFENGRQPEGWLKGNPNTKKKVSVEGRNGNGSTN